MATFWWFLPSNAPIMLYDIHYWSFFLSQGNRWTKYLAHPKIQKSKPCLLMFAPLVTLDGFHLQQSTQLSANLTPGSMFISIAKYLCKNSFLLHWNSCKQCSELLTCFWSTVSKRGTHFEHNFLIEKCSCKMMNTLPSDIFNSSAISCIFYLWSAETSWWSFFGVFRDNCWIWVTWAFSIICVCTTAFKVSIPPNNHCFRWSRVRITLIKLLLCLNSIFFPSESNALSTHKIQIFLFWKFATVPLLK